jgi:asparagine synthase (glutamine-hydrolysing)
VSGFVGLWQHDGRPVEPALLDTLTESLRFRGPDGLATWHRGSVGLGHARFVTHARRDGEPQPLAIDERYRIAGDIRLDAREELIAALPASPGESDAALVLRAYRAWGEKCLARLHGDFAFAIWDEHEQRLFCARDPFGVRPFFYAALPGTFLCGNTLNTLRRHPDVGDALDEQALADFLVCGYPLDPALSFFRDIRRLPAAHCLTVTASATRIARYWDLPQPPALRHRRAADYVEQFADVLSRALADRAGSGPVGISLSGGLDSGAIAAAMVGRLGTPPRAQRVLAFCSGWTCAFDDPEPRAAARTADALGLALEVIEAPDCVPLRRLPAAWAEPEPAGDYFSAQFVASLARMASATRVNLDGQGADEIFGGETLLDEARREPIGRLALDALRTWATVRRPAFGLRSRLLPARALHALQRVPKYLDAKWQRGLGLAERLRAVGPQASTTAAPGRRPVARARLGRRIWGPYLESFDAGFTGVAIETRWPYLDERVVRFALSLPPLPWCVDKYLLRRSLERILPRAITARPKSPLAGDPLESFVAREPRWVASAPPDSALGGRVDRAAWQKAWQAPRPDGALWQLARPLALAQWSSRSGAPLDALPARAVGAVKSPHARPKRRREIR